MTLRELVIGFRGEHGISQRQFAAKCGLSNGYISMLEKNMNPKTGLPLTPSLIVLKKLADGMGMTLNQLFMEADDMPVDMIRTEHNKMPISETKDGHHSGNIIKIAGRDGSFRERQLSDEQLAAINAILNQMPDASNDL